MGWSGECEQLWADEDATKQSDTTCPVCGEDRMKPQLGWGIIISDKTLSHCLACGRWCDDDLVDA
jgi:hypothetical protein